MEVATEPVAPASGSPAPVAAPVAAPAGGNPPAAAPDNSGTPAPAATPGVSLSAPVTPPAGEQLPDVFSGLSEDHKKMVQAKGWKGLDDALKSYSEAEKALSTRATAVEAPKAVTDYDQHIVKPEDADKLGYSDEFAKWLKDTSFKLKIPVEATKGLHDEFVQWARANSGKAGEDQTAAVTERVNKAGTTLLESWGQPNTPKFTRNVEMAKRAVENLHPDLKAALVETGAIVNVGGKEMVANAVIADAFAKVGAAMFAEDTLFGSTDTAQNPFDPATLNITKATQLVKTDRTKAAAFVRALKPADQARWAHLLT